MKTILTQEQNMNCLTDVLQQLSEDSLKMFHASTKNKYEQLCVGYFENGRNDMITPEIERLRYMLETINKVIVSNREQFRRNSKASAGVTTY
jgi:hypothetical protein